MSEQAMRMALEVLGKLHSMVCDGGRLHDFVGWCPDHTQPESRDYNCPGCAVIGEAEAAITALRAALDAPQQPVARVVPLDATVRLEWASVEAAHNAKPGLLYTTPQAAPATALDAGGWQPAKTMPKDYGSYLVADAVRGNVAPCIRGVIHNNTGTDWDWQYGEAITHWMPLPAAPKE